MSNSRLARLSAWPGSLRGARTAWAGPKEIPGCGVINGVGAITVADTPMHTHEEQRINDRLDADTLLCAVGAIGFWSILLALCLLLPSA